jgi:hypothetical protein
MKGLILKESLADDRVLELVRITKTETWQVRNAVAGQPPVWTALSFEAGDDQADVLAGELSRALKPRGWYINASTATHVFVVFFSKVFNYPKGEAAGREEAIQYGRSAGIPESQLDWSE